MPLAAAAKRRRQGHQAKPIFQLPALEPPTANRHTANPVHTLQTENPRRRTLSAEPATQNAEHQTTNEERRTERESAPAEQSNESDTGQLADNRNGQTGNDKWRRGLSARKSIMERHQLLALTATRAGGDDNDDSVRTYCEMWERDRRVAPPSRWGNAVSPSLRSPAVCVTPRRHETRRDERERHGVTTWTRRKEKRKETRDGQNENGIREKREARNGGQGTRQMGVNGRGYR